MTGVSSTSKPVIARAIRTCQSRIIARARITRIASRRAASATLQATSAPSSPARGPRPSASARSATAAASSPVQNTPAPSQASSEIGQIHGRTECPRSVSNDDVASTLRAISAAGDRPLGETVATPTRSAPTGCCSRASRKEPEGAAQGVGAPISGPAVASSSAAQSRTVHVIAWSQLSPPTSGPYSDPMATSPLEGLNPNTPQHPAGTRIDPPESVACAIGTIPEATAAAAPPLDPPGVRVRSQGLAVGP